MRRRIDVTSNDLDGRPVYEVAPTGSGDTRGHMLYLHGGGYVIDLIPAVHWPFIARLACTLRRTVTVPIYPLAPEHSYRDVFRFLLRVYDRMLTVRPAGRVLVAGRHYAGGDPLDTPLVSPGFGEIAGLPPLSIYTGTHDVLNPDTRAFRARAEAARADVRWHEKERARHCWMVLPGKHSRTAIETMRHKFS